MTELNQLPTIGNGRAIDRSAIPELPVEAFQQAILDAVDVGQRVASLFGVANPQGETVRLYIVLADDQESRLRLATTTVADQFQSLTPRCLQVHLFEREIAEQYGIRPEGHPWFKPVRFHSSYRPGHDAWGRKTGEAPVVGVTDFYRVEGDEIHEVAVGPVHAGVIEPGHFRFQCHGEQVFHLEISLGYQHRGAENRGDGCYWHTSTEVFDRHIRTPAQVSPTANLFGYQQLRQPKAHQLCRHRR